jgi:ATP-dependent DNA helicase RecG
VVAINVNEGNQKPYRTKSGKYLMRSGADKRSVSQEELSRMLQSSGSFHIEELAIRGATIEEQLDRTKFYLYFEKQYEQSLYAYAEDSNQSVETILNNMNLAQGNDLNLVGTLLFAKQPQRFRPTLLIKAVIFFGNEIADNNYFSSEDIDDTLEVQYSKGFYFLMSDLRRKQAPGASFNSLGVLEISKVALEEALVNALVHRDYSKLGSVKLLVFENRIEIISPGALPNHLTVENIKNGNAVPRNPILLSFCSKILPYRGLGSGIRRILKEHPRTDFINDQAGQQFKVVLWR